jgi:proline dehydrogenase
VLGENVKSEKQALLASETYLTTAQELYAGGLDGGIAIKLSNLGANFDKSLAREDLLNIYKKTESLNVNLELDMEGMPMVDYTIESAIECSKKGYHVTMALQAYLDRSKDDLKTALEHEITVRVVKGAYLGDTDDFAEIQKRFRTLVDLLLQCGQHFTIGTHDPELIEWVKVQAVEQKELIEFGFLKGLADETKLELVEDGWAVVEYIPFGHDYKAYVTRRKRYLKELDRLGRHAVP